MLRIYFFYENSALNYRTEKVHETRLNDDVQEFFEMLRIELHKPYE